MLTVILLHEDVLSKIFCSTEATSHLEEDLQLLGLCSLQDVRLQVFAYGHTHVNLVVRTHHHTGGNVVADLRPVKIVPETLGQPVEAHLWSDDETVIENMPVNRV